MAGGGRAGWAADESHRRLPPAPGGPRSGGGGPGRAAPGPPREVPRTGHGLAPHLLSRPPRHAESGGAGGAPGALRPRRQHQPTHIASAPPSGSAIVPRARGENTPSLATGEPVDDGWGEGAGSLLLLAAAQETGLVDALRAALPAALPADNHRRDYQTPTSRQALILTLLFLGAVGLRRTWDLRGYTGDALALLAGRGRAYGYCHVERFLAAVARAGGAETVTDGVTAWAARLWSPSHRTVGEPPPAYYRPPDKDLHYAAWASGSESSGTSARVAIWSR